MRIQIFTEQQLIGKTHGVYFIHCFHGPGLSDLVVYAYIKPSAEVREEGKIGLNWRYLSPPPTLLDQELCKEPLTRTPMRYRFCSVQHEQPLDLGNVIRE